MNWVIGRRAVLIAVLVTVLSPLAAFAQSAPATCKTGVFVSDIYKVSQPTRSFDSDLWFWSVCPNDDHRPLQTMEYINASKVDASLDSTIPRGAAVWSNRKVVGTWRHDWNVADFPFDRQTLHMVVEEGVDDSRTFVYDPDIQRSGYDNRIDIPGWKITGFRLTPSLETYTTSFGDPTLAVDASSDFSRLTIEVDIQREGLLYFLKLTAVAYIAAVLALMSFRIDPLEDFSARFGLLAASLFATVVNMSSANSQLGSADQLTLVDMIHIGGLLLIVGTAILALVSNHLVIHGHDQAANRRADLRYLITCAVMFAIYNVALLIDVLIVH